ncbi:MAG: hypothetical protein IKU38_08265 [Clostridia bacterium]|nr:hypothetical protein [Clostridia bacterium]
MLRRTCVVMALAVVVLDPPKWAAVAAMAPAALLLVDCVARLMGKGVSA